MSASYFLLFPHSSAGKASFSSNFICVACARSRLAWALMAFQVWNPHQCDMASDLVVRGQTLVWHIVSA